MKQNKNAKMTETKQEGLEVSIIIFRELSHISVYHARQASIKMNSV